MADDEHLSEKTDAAKDAESTQKETLQTELETAEEHREQEHRDEGEGEDLHGELPTEGGSEDPPRGTPEHDEGRLSG